LTSVTVRSRIRTDCAETRNLSSHAPFIDSMLTRAILTHGLSKEQRQGLRRSIKTFAMLWQQRFQLVQHPIVGKYIKKQIGVGVLPELLNTFLLW